MAIDLAKYKLPTQATPNGPSLDISKYKLATPEPTPAPSLGQLSGEQVVQGAQKIVESVKRGAERFSAAPEMRRGMSPIDALATEAKRTGVLLEAGLGTAAGAVQGIFAPFTATAKKAADVIGVHPIEMAKQGAKAFFPQASQTLKEAMADHPDATRNVMDLFTVGGAVLAPNAKSLFTRPSRSVDDLIEQAHTAITPKRPPPGGPGGSAGIPPLTKSPSATRATAEATAPDLSIAEKWVGLSPDIKRRLAGKQDKLREYFDVAHARNADDTLPTAYEYGSRRAQTAVDAMETQLNQTGGKIGAFRQKIGTYQAHVDDVARVEQSFDDQLTRLNLEVHNGQVRQIPGTVTRVGTSGDISVLANLYKDILTVKQSPTLTNLIDLRSAFDNRINFAKQTREVSSSVDPLSRQVRKSIADVSARIVGKSEAAQLKQYSDFMDAYSDLRSYTDRKAGGEYLLRLVLSGRGGEARQIIQTIKEYTGIDLMDDATMMTLATDFIGNQTQKSLFRQEVTKAGLDAAALLKGDVKGMLGTILQKTADKAINPEKILLKAAK